jgi:uncharacterized membrane protein YfcA
LFLLRPVLKFPTNTSTVITGGGISGLITGLLGTGGVLRATFLTGFNLEKATAAVIALATDATRIPSYLSQGFLLEQYYYYTITYPSFLLLQCLVLVQYHIEG